MISGSEVIDPCPISVAADMIVMVPSGAMLTHGDSAWPTFSAATIAALARPPVTNANESPAAPIITWRRDSTAKSLLCAFMSRLPRRALDRAHDALIGAAPADVGAHVLDDLLVCRFRIMLEQVRGAHDLAALTVATLRHPLGKPGF